MTSRRDLLKGAAVVVATASSIGLGHRRAGAQAARSRIDDVLRQAVDARDVPGVVAMAATDKGVLYEGAFGMRALGPGHGHDARHGLPHRLDDQGHHVGRGDAARRAGQAQARRARARIDPALGLAPGAGRLRRLRRAEAPSGQAADHAAPPADPHRGLRLRACGTPTSDRYVKTAGLPPRATGKLATIRMPLVFDPGDRWDYGINIDWVGPPRRVDQRPAARRLLPGQDLRAARHEGQRVSPLGRAARAPGARAHAAARRRARAPAA